MRKPRDYDAELKALTDKARQLKGRKQSQLGELVMATGADALSAEELAGALLVAATTNDGTAKEACTSACSSTLKCTVTWQRRAFSRKTAGPRSQLGSPMRDSASRA